MNQDHFVVTIGGTQELEITFQRSNTADAAAAVRLLCYVDAAYATTLMPSLILVTVLVWVT
jgi:hypothetical protein